MSNSGFRYILSKKVEEAISERNPLVRKNILYTNKVEHQWCDLYFRISVSLKCRSVVNIIADMSKAFINDQEGSKGSNTLELLVYDKPFITAFVNQVSDVLDR